jgi:hypothetical protein
VALIQWTEIRCPRCHRLMFKAEPGGSMDVTLPCLRCKKMWRVVKHDLPGLQGGIEFKELRGKAMSKASREIRMDKGP